MKIIAEFNNTDELFKFINDFQATPALRELEKTCESIHIGTSEESNTQEAIEDTKDTKEVSEPTPSETPKEAAPAEPEKEVTKEDVRAIFTSLVKAGKQSEAKALTKKYGAAKLPDLKPEYYAAVYKEAKDLWVNMPS